MDSKARGSRWSFLSTLSFSAQLNSLPMFPTPRTPDALAHRYDFAAKGGVTPSAGDNWSNRGKSIDFPSKSTEFKSGIIKDSSVGVETSGHSHWLRY